MKIELKQITIREVVKNYQNSNEEGVIGFDGLLNIRPKYQREFIYKDIQRDEVIKTIQKGFPLNVMYWVKNSNGTFEVLDGQQRTISFCEYVAKKFSVDGLGFHNLTDDKQKQILDYKLMIYWCEGEESEKLDWFKIINIAGEKLTDQEIRNAVYSGSWVTDAKRHFSKSGCVAYSLAHNYLKGVSIRQEYLETAIKWINSERIEEYMSKNQHEPNANELWLYFQSVISWTKLTFPNYRKEMKGVNWGFLYNRFKDKKLNTNDLEAEISRLMKDEDVTKKSGIYPYLLTKEEKYLNIRNFTDNQKREAYEKQNGICKVCNKEFEINEMESDHITPWHVGGKTIAENCQMLCKDDNRKKSGK